MNCKYILILAATMLLSAQCQAQTAQDNNDGLNLDDSTWPASNTHSSETTVSDETDSLSANTAAVAPSAGTAASTEANASAEVTTPSEADGADIKAPGMKKIKVGNKVFNIANQNDEAHIYNAGAGKDNILLVVSKKDFRMYVYQTLAKDTTLVATFPVCYARNAGCKTKQGDSCTPDCTAAHPFRISQIQDASGWTHDFKDGRGSFRAYGHWFMRLNLSDATNLNASVRANRSIGIHGSTGNSQSVPGRDSEGCIRLRDADIITLHDKFAKVGTPVIVRAAGEDKYPFEVRAEKKLGAAYKAPTAGNPLLKQYTEVK